jgi:deoxyadenosine/deoxycytidine kinase
MLIAIEGCIGAGKSTVAKGLAEYRKSDLLLERFEEHPFLKLFYGDPSETATETEVAFLLLHYSQLRTVISSSPRETIADFHLSKDLLYAELNLTDSRTKIGFVHLYEYFAERVPSPTVLVYLSAQTDLILKRIRQRNRDFEAAVDPAYYARVNGAYDTLFARYSGVKLSIPMEEWDFVKRPTLYQGLSALIDIQLKSHK